MDRKTLDPRQVAYDLVDRVLKKGIAQGHNPDAWKTEPTTMHLQKAARHAITACLLLDHPEYTKDDETALEHAENCLTRCAMALVVLKHQP